MLESAGVEVLESAAGVVVSGAVALASAGVDPVVLESVAAGVVVSTGVVLAVVLVALASVVEPATIEDSLPDSITVALLLAKSTCAPSVTVLSALTSSPVEAKNLFKAMALRSGVRIKILPLLGAAIMRYTKLLTPEPSVTFARKKRALLVFGISMDFKFAPPAPISRLDMAWLDPFGFAANNSSVTLLAA